MARALGVAGLLPQVLALGLAIAGSDDWQDAGRALAAIYAALILTFLGGTWWGIAAGAPAAERRGGLGWLWIAAVMPSLVALACLGVWGAGLVPVETALVMLGASLLLALGVDARIGSLAPKWWMSLRAPLSLGLGLLTLAVALA